MKHIALNIKETRSRIRQTERGELLRYFVDRLNPSRMRDGLPKISMPRMGKILEQIPTKDLYYLKRVCDDAGNFSKKVLVGIGSRKAHRCCKKRERGTKRGDISSAKITVSRIRCGNFLEFARNNCYAFQVHIKGVRNDHTRRGGV